MSCSKILIVEDDPLVSKSIKEQLIHGNYTISGIFSNGKDAIDSIETEKPDLILMDINLKGDLDGVETTRIIRSKYDIPVVYITGLLESEIIEKAKMTGPYGYLVKPIMKRELAITIEMAIYKHRIDKRLKLNEERYKAILQDHTEMICRYLPDGSLSFVNDAYCQYYHKTVEELIGKNFIPIVPENDRLKILHNHQLLNKEKPVDTIEYRIITFDGKIRWQLWTNRAIFDDQGEIIEYQAVGHDITERKKTEEDLVAEKERLAVTLRSINDGVIAVDKEGKVVLVNKVAEDITGYCMFEAIGQPLNKIFNVINKNSRKAIDDPVQKVIIEGRVIESKKETLLISRTLLERFIEYSVSPMRDKDNIIIGVVLVFRDITEKRKMEEELQRVHNLESLGILAGGIAHDFNNIITAILGNISLVKIDLNQADKTYQILEDAEKAVKQAKDLAQQLLTFAKGGAPIKKTTTISDLIMDSANFVLRGSNSKCEFIITDDLLPVEIDEGQISQVINNMIINADQAMPDGGIIKISVENINLDKQQGIPLPDGNYIKIAIQDQGIGISKKNLKNIFVPYFTTKKNGNGLGLTTCYSIIKKHDGHITVESEVGHGTTFSIFLPVSMKQLYKRSPEVELISDDSQKNQKVLVMDDDESIRKVVKRILKFLGYQCECAKNGKEALEFYQTAQKDNEPFSVVIMDLTISGDMGGKKTIKQLLKIDPQAKVIVSSGYSDAPIMANYQDYGFKGVIAKPYNINELKKILIQVIDGQD